MNYNPQLLAFQGFITSLNNSYVLSNINARGGNEDTIFKIVTELFSFLQERELISKDGVPAKSTDEMRKLTFYLLLNADFPALETLIEMPGVDTVIWTIPTIPTCLLCEIVWGLNLEPFLQEAISFCTPKYAVQILKTFVDSLKYGTPQESIKRIKVLIAACYHLMCRLCFYEIDTEYLTEILQDLFNRILTCLNYFVEPPNAEKITRFSEELKYKFIGSNLMALLTLNEECLLKFTSDETYENAKFDDLYLCTVSKDNINTAKKKHENQHIMEILNKSNIALLDFCKRNVMDINVDIFCAWSEFEENGKTMQQSIGEHCYHLLNKVTSIVSLSDHPITSILPQMSRKPVDIMDIITNADDETIIQNITLNNEHQKLWIKALLDKNNYFLYIDLTECLKLNIKYLDKSDCLKIVESYFSLDSSVSSIPEVKLLMIKAFAGCEYSNREQFTDRHFADSTFNDNLETTDFHNMITELFNRLIHEENQSECYLQDILNVFIQNPRTTYNKILNTAIENKKQCGMMTKLLGILQNYSKHRYNSDIQATMIKCFEEYPLTGLADKQLNNYVYFVVTLTKESILPCAQLLLLIIMTNLHKALVTRDAPVIGVFVKILDKAFILENLIAYRAPLLAMLAQILAKLRWTIETFNTSLPDVVEQTLQLQMKIFQSYGDSIPEQELNWLRTKISNLDLVDRYYFRKLWNIQDDNMLRVLCKDNLQIKDIAFSNLMKVLSRTTIREWNDMWLNFVQNNPGIMPTGLLKLLGSFLTVLTVTVSKKRTESSVACLDYYFRSLLLLIQNEFLPLNPAKEDVVEFLRQLAPIIDKTHEEDLVRMETVILPFIALLHERYRGNLEIDNNFVKLIINHNNFAVKIKQMCVNGDSQ